jgi:hypothetical protein
MFKKYYIISREFPNLFWNPNSQLFQTSLTKDCLTSIFKIYKQYELAACYISRFYHERDILELHIKKFK